ncbi:hypothetical protein WJX72_010119 [[Myrmecia] bisecta]|uniref:BZIP domain-containing protein n=1 Tax=[Myrmecia] bisecta TaxID=41462 RepID=A0AAW1PMG5_9CHLO
MMLTADTDYCPTDVPGGPRTEAHERSDGEMTSSGASNSPAATRATSAAKAATKEKPKRWKNRTHEQWVQNKLAQKQYRQRKKEHVAQLQAAADELALKMAQLSNITAEASALERRNHELEAALGAKQAEIATARAQSASGSGQTSVSGGSGRDAQLSEDRAAQCEAFTAAWHRQIHELRAYLESVGLGDGQRVPNDPQQTDPGVNLMLKHHMEDVLSFCIKAYRMEEHDLAALATASYAEVADLQQYEDPKKWLRCAEELNFTPSQRRCLLQRRRQVLPRFERLYADRQSLNLGILKLLLPAALNGVPGEAGKQEQRQAAALLAAVQALEDNLAEEQRIYSEEDYVLFNDLLTPVQGAWLHLKAFPDHCDPLPLMAAVEILHPEDAP